jgi:hypothetical protein
LERIAPGSAALAANRQSLVAKFADSSVVLARDQAGRGEFIRARQTLQAVLEENVSPGYPPAQALLKELDDADIYNPAQTPGHANATKKVKDLFIIAQGMVDLADYKAAKVAYEQILAVDETNTAARRGMERVEKLINDHLRSERDYTRAKMLNDVDAEWETEVPTALRQSGTRQPGEAASGGEAVSPARLKMQSIILDRLAMADSPLQEALTYIANKAVELDSAERNATLRSIASFPETICLRIDSIRSLLLDANRELGAPSTELLDWLNALYCSVNGISRKPSLFISCL